MLRSKDDLFHGADFYEFAGIHDSDPVSYLPEKGQLMGNKRYASDYLFF